MKVTARSLLAASFAFLTFCALVPATAAAGLGLFPEFQAGSTRLAKAASFIHFGLLGWIAAVVFGIGSLLAARGRWPWLVAAPAVAGFALQSWWITPYYVADRDHGTPSFELSVINVEFGADDPQTLRERVEGSDVVVLLEADAQTVQRLQQHGFAERFPHRVGEGAADPVSGTVIYSRLPMKDLGLAPTAFESRLVRLETPTGPVLLAGVHPVNPMGGARDWTQDAAALESFLRPHFDEPLVIAGDFNAIDRHHTMQPWWDAGLRSSADLSGAGLQRTWPQGGWEGVPTAVIGIDHVLVSLKLSASEHRLFTIPDSDHAGIRTRIGKRV